MILPVASSTRASVWLLCSLYIERTRHSSSATLPRWGITSDRSMPHSPRGTKRKGVPSSTFCSLPGWNISTFVAWRLPSSRFNSGLGSNSSIWLGPPFCTNITTALARAAKCPWRGRRSSGPFCPSAASRPSCCKMLASARVPRPKPDSSNSLRREMSGHDDFGALGASAERRMGGRIGCIWGTSAPSGDIQELVAAQQHVAEPGQGLA